MPTHSVRTLRTVAFLLWTTTAATARAQTPRFEVTYPAPANAGPITGRLVVMISKTAQPEPRFGLGLRGPAMAAVDLEQLKPGEVAVVDKGALVFLAKLPD